MKSVIIFVPHQDDEINVAGCIFEQLHKNHVKITVVFCTNGDAYPRLSRIRFLEAKKVKKIFDYDELIYLGYGNGYKGKHIYDLDNNEVALAKSGKTETYFPGEGHEYCYRKYGCHHLYTRENYKKDIKDVILEKAADTIICVDLDRHPDHRCLSLLFDEVICDILKENQSYKPLILKKFAYLGVWHGNDDFFDRIIKTTEPSLLGEMSTPHPYEWEDRIRIKTPYNYLGLTFWNNRIFKALNKYESQSILLNPRNSGLLSFTRIVNGDIVYWVRRTDNLAYKAQISTSSGDDYYLSDFKIYETNDIRNENLIENGLYWMPDKDDKDRRIVYTFEQPVELSIIVIYQNPLYSVKRMTVKTDSGYVGEFEFKRSSVINLHLPFQSNVNEIILNITESYEKVIKIGEIEIFKDNIEYKEILAPLDLIESSMGEKERNVISCFLCRQLYRVYTQIRIRYNNLKYRNKLS